MWLWLYFRFWSLVLFVLRWLLGIRYFDLNDLTKSIQKLECDENHRASVAILAKRCWYIEQWLGWRYFDPNNLLKTPITNVFNQLMVTPHHDSYASLLLSFGVHLPSITLLGPTTEMQWHFDESSGWQLEQFGVPFQVSEVSRQVFRQGAMTNEIRPWLLHMHMMINQIHQQASFNVMQLTQRYDALILSQEMLGHKLTAIKQHWFYGWFIAHKGLDAWREELIQQVDTLKNWLQNRFSKHQCDPWMVIRLDALKKPYEHYCFQLTPKQDIHEKLKQQWVQEWQVQRQKTIFCLSWCDLVIRDVYWVKLLKNDYPAVAIIHEVHMNNVDLAWAWDKLMLLDQAFCWQSYLLQSWYAWYGHVDEWQAILAHSIGFNHDALLKRVSLQTTKRWCLESQAGHLCLVEQPTRASWSDAQIKQVMFQGGGNEPGWLSMYPLWLWWMQQDQTIDPYWYQQLNRLEYDAIQKAITMCPKPLLDQLVTYAKLNMEHGLWHDVDYFLLTHVPDLKANALKHLNHYVQKKSNGFGEAIKADPQWKAAIKTHAAAIIKELSLPISTTDQPYIDQLSQLMKEGQLTQDLSAKVNQLVNHHMLQQWFCDEATPRLLEFFEHHGDHACSIQAVNERLRDLIWRQMRQAQQSHQLGMWLWQHFNGKANAWVKHQIDADFFTLIITHHACIDGWLIAWPTELAQGLYCLKQTFKVNPLLAWLVTNEVISIPQGLYKRMRTMAQISKNNALYHQIDQWIASMDKPQRMPAWPTLSILQCEETTYGFNCVQTRVAKSVCTVSR